MRNVITISRQSGSGGRTIARKLAERLGYKCYDGELIEQIAQETGLAKEYISKTCENASSANPFIFSMERTKFSRFGANLSIRDEVFKAMREIIERLSSEGNCIFVGRCADYILKDNKNALHLFIYADNKYRIERITTKYGEELKHPDKELEERDKKRKIFYSNYTFREWGETSNYSLCLNSGVIGEDKIVDIIEKIAKGE